MHLDSAISDVKRMRAVLNSINASGIDTMRKIVYTFDKLEELEKSLIQGANESKLSSTVSPTEPEKTE